MMDFGDYEAQNVRPVRSKDWVEYHCTRCGQCCRHLKNAVMLESMDLYRLAQYLRATQMPTLRIEDITAQYAEIVPLTDTGYPIYTLKTVGPDDACIFLKDNRCTVYEARPRTCRLYPFTAAPGRFGRDFAFFLCTELPHHLNGGRVSVKDWLYTNFRRAEKDYVLQEYAFAEAVNPLLKKVAMRNREQMLFLLLYYHYTAFDLDAPFLPQYRRNNQAVLEQLQRLAEEAAEA